MKGSCFQRHLVEDSYAKAKSWEEQVVLDRGKPLNAEYELMTTDLTLKWSDTILDQAVEVPMSLAQGKEANTVTNGLRSRVPKNGVVIASE